MPNPRTFIPSKYTRYTVAGLGYQLRLIIAACSMLFSITESTRWIEVAARMSMMPGSKIVLPSSDVKEYSGTVLRSTVSRIANPKGIDLILFSYKL